MGRVAIFLICVHPCGFVVLLAKWLVSSLFQRGFGWGFDSFLINGRGYLVKSGGFSPNGRGYLPKSGDFLVDGRDFSGFGDDHSADFDNFSVNGDDDLSRGRIEIAPGDVLLREWGNYLSAGDDEKRVDHDERTGGGGGRVDGFVRAGKAGGVFWPGENNFKKLFARTVFVPPPPASWAQDYFGMSPGASANQNNRQQVMANYDAPGISYDSGVLYDAPDLPPLRRKVMAKVKFSLDALPDAQIIQQCTNIKTALTGNANFTTPTPSLAAFGTAITAAGAKLTTSDNAQNAAKQAVVDKDTAIQTLLGLVSQLGTYVELTSGGDEAKILSAGMQVRAARAPASVPSTVQNLSLTAGDNAGQLDLQWDPTGSAKRYEVQLCAAADFASGVTNLPSVTKSKTLTANLTSGARIWARVRGLNAAGPGAWSDVATKIVP